MARGRGQAAPRQRREGARDLGGLRPGQAAGRLAERSSADALAQGLHQRGDFEFNQGGRLGPTD